MNQSNPSGNYLWKILKSPVSQLLHGRVTGEQTLLERLDTSPLRDDVVASIHEIISLIPRFQKSKATRQLVKSCKEQLKKGQNQDQLVDQLDAENIAEMIREYRSADWVLNSSIPASLWPVINKIVGDTKGFGWRWKKKAKVRQQLDSVCRSFQGQLEAGQTPEELVTKYGDAIAIRDLIQQTRSTDQLLDNHLPESVISVVLDVVKRTRLWPNEKSDTAQELFSHFSDGLEKGNSADQLIKDFGSPKVSAKLIRRACLRKRPLAWRVWRRTWQSSFAMLGLIIVVWGILFARLIVANSTITFDMVQEHDDASRAIPITERAWPVYRAGLIKLSKEDEPLFRLTENIKLGLNEGPENEHWPEAKKFLIDHRESVELFLKASSHSELGFINRDPDNAGWLKLQGFAEGYQLNSFNELSVDGIDTILPAAQELSAIVSKIFNGEIFLAAENNDGDRCLKILLANLEVSKHYRQTWRCPLTQMGLNGISIHTGEIAVKLILSHPDLFTEKQLITFFREFEAMKIRDPEFKDAERGIEDYLQKIYTDDGQGNGRITSVGCQIIGKLGFSDGTNGMISLKSSIPAHMNIQLVSAPVVSLVAGRKEMKKKLLLLNQLMWEKRVYSTTAEQLANSKFRIEYKRLMESPRLRIKYLPALAYIYADQDSYWKSAPRFQVKRDTVFVMIAAELYRLSHGEFPETAEQLVSDLLPEMPMDPYTKKPLKYSVKGGQPFVDSIGLQEE